MARSLKTSRPFRAKRRSSSVPGSYRGFSYQATRFLVRLLRSQPRSTISLEAFEDVGVETASGSRVAEQTKSYVSRNPLSTRAPELWKSLSNWVTAVVSGEFQPDTTEFVFCAPGANPSEIAKKFHDATSLESANAAVDFVSTALTVKGQTAASIELRRTLKFLLRHRDRFCQVVRSFSIDTPSADADDELKPLLLAMLVSEDAYPHVVRWAHGWVKQRIDEQVALAKPAKVSVDEFHTALLNYVRSHDRLDMLQSFAGVPTAGDVESELSFREYVRQLRFIEIEDVAVLEAINDYLRALIDRTNWSERGFVDSAALDIFAQALTSAWRNIKRKTLLAYGDKAPEVQGQLLYSECIEYRSLLDGYDPPSHFVKGSFHALSDDHAIGWHPNYESMLKKTSQNTKNQTE
jgi:hypothetical protein